MGDINEKGFYENVRWFVCWRNNSYGDILVKSVGINWWSNYFEFLKSYYSSWGGVVCCCNCWLWKKCWIF